jgi:GR25 family glycosyltransferase involved in LPS biosynthesis
MESSLSSDIISNTDSVTIVTAYYNHPLKNFNEYDIFINNFLLNIRCNLIIFTSSDLIEYFKTKINNKLNIILIIHEFNKLELYKKYISVWESKYLTDNEEGLISLFYNIINNSKLNFIKEAIQLNYFNSNKFIWNDIEFIQNESLIDLLDNYPIYTKISNKNIDILSLNNLTDQNKKNEENIIFSDSLFGGTIETLLEYCRLYYEKFDYCLKNSKIIPRTNELILNIYLENKELFNIINPRVNNKIDQTKISDTWFYLFYYYSVKNSQDIQNKDIANKKYIIFKPAGRLGNALFRYLSAILFIIKNEHKHTYILDIECPILDQYNFYEGVDYIGNDTGMIQSNNIDEIKQSLYYNDGVIAFNSLGFCKNNIDFNNLKSSEYINIQNKQGLYVKNIITVNDNNFYNFIDKDLKDYNILLDGYFQFNHIYYDHKKEILEYIEKHRLNDYIFTSTFNGEYLFNSNCRFLIKDVLTDIILEDSKIYDIVIHLRLDDFADKDDFIDYIYLEELFSGMDFSKKKSCIVVEKPKCDFDINFLNKCLKWFNENNISINVESNSLMIDFNIMKNTKTLVCSMSTLSWCAAFFSKKIEKCIMPDYNFYDKDRKTFFKNPIENTLYYKVKSSKKLPLKIIIITLEEFPERLNKLHDLLNKFLKIGIEYEIFYGVNGKNIKIEDTEDENIKILSYNSDKFYHNKIVSNYRNGIKFGEIGCSWSHINVYKKILNDNEYNNYLILEDDVKLINNLDILENTLNNLPNDFDLLHLAVSDCCTNLINFKKKEKINSVFYSIYNQFFNRGTAYIVSKNGATKLLNYTNNFINMPADDLLSNTFNNTNNFNLYVPENPLFSHNLNIPSIVHTNDIFNKNIL